jgi:phage-related protein
MPDKPLVWLGGEIKSPPLSQDARRQAGWLLRRLQKGETLSMPRSRPMPSIGPRCHELRIEDAATGKAWRILYRVDEDAIVITDSFAKKSQATPKSAIARAGRRLKLYEQCANEDKR